MHVLSRSSADSPIRAIRSQLCADTLDISFDRLRFSNPNYMSPAPPLCSGPGPTRTGSMSNAARVLPTSTSPATAQTPATTVPTGRPTKPPRGYPVNVRSPPSSPEPRQRWNLEQEGEEPHSDTAVDTVTVAGSSEPWAALPKDNDDNGSEYAASSDEEDPVPAKRCRESARLRGVCAPSERFRTCRALRFLRDASRAAGESARTPRARSPPCPNARFWSRLVVDVARRRDRQNPTFTQVRGIHISNISLHIARMA
ncbi:hypothetical protein BJY52DRAFT_83317 [Lactarius psammicola]|nr:hypothetical protein BJY52DRAFT_83317 [Lactarius psammicola]